jgi:hypothetical protein
LPEWFERPTLVQRGRPEAPTVTHSPLIEEGRMVIKRIEPLQLAKVAGTLYALLGFIIGLLFTLFALGGIGLSTLPFGAAFGIGAVILLPLLYGCFGFIMSLIMAAFYNLVAGWVGGIVLQVE